MLNFHNFKVIQDNSFFEFKTRCQSKWGNIMFIIRRLEKILSLRYRQNHIDELFQRHED